MRFGGARKGLLKVGDTRILDRVADAMRPHCDRLVIVAGDERARDWLPDATVLADLRPGLGGLSGLHAALVQAGGPILVAPWDMPFIPSALFGLLRERGADVDAVVPESDSPYGFEPLVAWYAPSALPHLERALEDGELRAAGWQRVIPRLARIPRAEVAALGDPCALFHNVNTPNDLAEAQALLG